MASEIEMSAANYALLIFYDSCVVFLAVCVLPKNSTEKLCVLHLSNKRANGVHRTDCVSVHKTNRRDTDWAREHGTAHTTFNKTIKHKFSMLQPLSCVPGEARGKMSRPTWDRMRHNSITDCAIVRVSPATTKEKKNDRYDCSRWCDSVALRQVSHWQLLRLFYCTIPTESTGTHGTQKRSQHFHLEYHECVCLALSMSDLFGILAFVVSFFCCIDVAAPSIGKHCRLEIVDFRLLSILKKFSRGWFRLSEIVNINRCEKIIKYYDGKQSLDRVLMDLTKMFRFFQFPARIFNTFSPLLFPLLAAVSNVSLPLHGIKAYQVFNETLHFA